MVRRTASVQHSCGWPANGSGRLSSTELVHARRGVLSWHGPLWLAILPAVRPTFTRTRVRCLGADYNGGFLTSWALEVDERFFRVAGALIRNARFLFPRLPLPVSRHCCRTDVRQMALLGCIPGVERSWQSGVFHS